MISTEEIQKLADLARIEIAPEELESLRGDIDAIVEYISQIKNISLSEDSKNEDHVVDFGSTKNVLREDENPQSGMYTEKIIAAFPESKDGFLKVKKILG